MSALNLAMAFSTSEYVVTDVLVACPHESKLEMIITASN